MTRLGCAGCQMRLRGGGDTQSFELVSLWTCLFASAFAATATTGQLAKDDLIPLRSLLRHQVLAKELVSDTVRGGNTSALLLLVSGTPGPVDKKAVAGTATPENNDLDLKSIHAGLTTPAQFDLVDSDCMLWSFMFCMHACIDSDCMLWLFMFCMYACVCPSSGATLTINCRYRLHDISVMPYLNRAMLMALHYHLTRRGPESQPEAKRLLKLVVPGAGNQSNDASTPNIIDYGLLRGSLAPNVVRLQARFASPEEEAAAVSKLAGSASSVQGMGDMQTGGATEPASAMERPLVVDQSISTEWLYFRTDNGTEFHVDFAASQFGLFDYVQVALVLSLSPHSPTLSRTPIDDTRLLHARTHFVSASV